LKDLISKKYSGLILDFDGTVVNSEYRRLNTYKKSIKEIAGVEIKLIASELIGESEDNNLNYLCEKYNIKKYLLNIKKKRKELLFIEADKGFRKIKITDIIINKLSEKIPIIIASNSSREYLERALKKIKLDKIPFVSINDVKNGKPHPDLFKLASRKINVLEKNCLVLEDSEVGCKAAINAKIDYFKLTEENSIETRKINKNDLGNVNFIVNLFN